MTAYCYIRKSVVQPGVRTMSWEVQEAEARAMATRHGDDELTILSDWGKSGRIGAEGRPGYRSLLEAIESGSCNVLYAYSLSRLSRSLMEYARLAELCVKHGVKVRFAKEGEMALDTVSGRLIVSVLAAVAQMEAELAQERARDTVAARRARGDQIGPKRYGARPGEDLSLVVEAYEDAGSLQGAARLLTASGVPTRQGGIWRTSSVRAVLQKGAPDILRPGRQKGVKARQPYLLARLLRCHCGQMMSPQNGRSGVRYWCSRAAEDPGHPMPRSISESKVLPWVMVEVEGAGPEDRVYRIAADTEARAAASEHLRRLTLVYLEGGMEDVAYRAKRKTLEADLERLAAEGRMVHLPPPDWGHDDPADLNGWLRALLRYVQLDEAAVPVYAEWLLPAWRARRPA